MDISIKWLNEYLSPADINAEDAGELLTLAGFPVEGRRDLPTGDVVLDLEMTSNRGDCLSHLGCAREVVGASHAPVRRSLVLPAFDEPAPGAPVGETLSLENREPVGCPLFTARLIRAVKIGPSPAWLVEKLEALGQRSINNVVDVTNFITLELGNPCHVFDLGKLAGQKLIVRYATKGERLKTLYEGEHELLTTDLIVADAERPQSLAGVIGGFDSQVDGATTDVVFEMATWDPVTIRTTGRRLNIRTDAAYRFERTIDPRTLDFAARRAVALLCQLTGGQLAQGVLSEGAPPPTSRIVELRPSRCDLLLGIDTPPSRIAELLAGIGITCEPAGDDLLRCTIPAHRTVDLVREIDLIEEVARTRSLDAIPVKEKVEVSVHRPQTDEAAVRTIGHVLTGMGFYETVTFSFTSPARAELFCPKAWELVAVDDNRRKAEPTLRPSIIPSLLACRAANQDARADAPGGVRLFETASIFAQEAGKDRQTIEHRRLMMLMDVPGTGTKRSDDDRQHAVRAMRGTIDAIVRSAFGADAHIWVEPAAPCCAGWDADAFARLVIGQDGQEQELGWFGLVSKEGLKAFDLDLPVVCADLHLGVLTEAYPPKALAHRLPQFPGIARDLSLVVDEKIQWAQVDQLVASLALDMLVGREMVGVFRGKQAGQGRKSVTVRLHFRDNQRTLRHEEVDGQMERFTAEAKQQLGAEIRL